MQHSQVEGLIADDDTYLTITEARRIIAAVTGKASGSVVIDRERQLEDASKEPPPLVPGDMPEPGRAQPEAAAPANDHQPQDAPAPKGRPKPEPTFTMETAAGVRGVLVLTERPKARNHVFLDVEGERQEVPFAELRGVSAR